MLRSAQNVRILANEWTQIVTANNDGFFLALLIVSLGRMDRHSVVEVLDLAVKNNVPRALIIEKINYWALSKSANLESSISLSVIVYNHTISLGFDPSGCLEFMLAIFSGVRNSKNSLKSNSHINMHRKPTNCGTKPLINTLTPGKTSTAMPKQEYKSNDSDNVLTAYTNGNTEDPKLYNLINMFNEFMSSVNLFALSLHTLTQLMMLCERFSNLDLAMRIWNLQKLIPSKPDPSAPTICDWYSIRSDDWPGRHILPYVATTLSLSSPPDRMQYAYIEILLSHNEDRIADNILRRQLLGISGQHTYGKELESEERWIVYSRIKNSHRIHSNYVQLLYKYRKIRMLKQYIVDVAAYDAIIDAKVLRLCLKVCGARFAVFLRRYCQRMDILI